MSLSSEQVSQYTAIIDEIISNGDLATISTKQIRNGLQAVVDEDLSEFKSAIKELILVRFDKFSAAQSEAPTPSSKTNGHSASTKESKGSSRATSTPLSSTEFKEEEDEDISPPKKKKRKVDSDAALAAKLQAQENGRTSRSTRGGGAKVVKKRAAAPKKKREKSSKKVGEDDDSDVLGSDGEKKVAKKGGFHKEFLLSPQLADIVGATKMSRPQVVKTMWDHIKLHDLQVPEDKRQIRCDDRMQLVFKTDKVHMFTMNKLLSKHLYPLEEVQEE